MDERAGKLLKEAKEHLKFVMKIYKMQLQEKRLFLHEHPSEASSWYMTEVQEVKVMEGVSVAIADQCMYGLKTWSTDKRKADTPARKRTKFMSNSTCILNELNRTCDGKHKHQELTNGRAKKAAIYPVKLCKVIICGIYRHMKEQ